VSRRFTALALTCLTVLGSAGCGYALAGRGSFLPAYIQTIAVPVFANRTAVFNLETVLTEKVRSEFIGRGKYQIQPGTANADAVLTGVVTSVDLQPGTLSDAGLVSRYLIRMTAQIEFRDVRTDTVLWEDPQMVFREDYEASSGQSGLDPAAFFGQEANAVDRITTDFAHTIVSAILEAF
jgi:hypothetical protein